MLGSVIGRLDPHEPLRWTPLGDAQGEPLAVKCEGIVVSRTDPTRVHVVLDSDAPDTPAELMDAGLTGPWWPPASRC